jgi:UDP-arabinose 4-epimerase
MRGSVLVTGGAGYIGAHTCKALAQAGYLPVTYDNLSEGHRDFVRWGPFVEGDIGDTVRVAETCRANEIIATIHFAAHALVGESMLDPAKYFRNNVAATIYFLDGLRSAGVGAIVFSSSCAVYGAPKEQPINEETPTNPINPYGASKLMVERILADCGQAYGLHWAALRYFNACGADREGQIGELRKQETHLIPRAMMWLQGHLDDFRVFGTDYPTPDGTAIRDYIHVCDLADAHVLTLEKLLSDQASGIFNLGTGSGHSVKQVLAEIARITRLNMPPIAGERRPGDPPTLLADPARARNDLGFGPSASDLETIIKTAWAWHQKAHPARRPAR